jgi:hypothetical protein
VAKERRITLRFVTWLCDPAEFRYGTSRKLSIPSMSLPPISHSPRFAPVCPHPPIAQVPAPNLPAPILPSAFPHSEARVGYRAVDEALRVLTDSFPGPFRFGRLNPGFYVDVVLDDDLPFAATLLPLWRDARPSRFVTLSRLLEVASIGFQI